MQKKGESRVREYLSKRKRYQRWISVVVVLAILVGLTTIYSLNQDASATTQDGAEEVGMVLESESDSQENASEGQDGEAQEAENNSSEGSAQDEESYEEESYEEESYSESSDVGEENTDSADDSASVESSEDTESEDDEASDASTAATSSEDIKEDDYVEVSITVSVVDEDGNILDQKYSDMDVDDLSFDSNGVAEVDASLFGNLSINNSDDNKVYYEYSGNSLNGESVTGIKKAKAKTDSSSADSSSEASDEERYTYYYTKDNSDWIKITSDAKLVLTYEEKGVAVDLSMSVVDEFGEEIDSSYTDMKLASFTEDVLTLDDTDNAPVSKVRKVIKTYSTYKQYSSEYMYVHATIDGTVIKNIKRTSLDDNGGAYAYAYTTDGDTYTDITDDAVVVLEYASNDSDTYKFTYDDENVIVTAVLQNANAIPEDAVLKATRITEGDVFDSYIEALNDAEEDVAEEDRIEHTAENTLLYDIAFIVTEKDDSGKEIEVEYEPAEGSVKITIEFKNNQLSDIGISSVEDIEVSHMILSDEAKEAAATTLEASETADASDITIEEITADSVEADSQSDANEIVEFVAESFSVYAITISKYGAYAEYKAVSDYNYEKSLGDAYDYGVVTNTYTWSGDTESNIMAGYVVSSGKDVGASQNYSNAGGNNYFGDFDTKVTNINFHQVPANIYLGYGATTKFNNGKLTFENVNGTNIVKNSNLVVSSIIDGIETYYEQYEGLGGSFEARHRDLGGTVLDLRNLPDGTYVVTYTGNNIHIDDEKLSIYLNEGQHLILNCTSSDLTIGTYLLNGVATSSYVGNNDASKDWLTTAVIFNVINAKNLVISNTCGTFIAPNSDVSTGAVNAGVVVANSIKSGNEWHYHNHDLPSNDKPLGGTLRIHKMVVNDFGSDFVRNKTKTALLQQVTFRIINTSDKSYIVFTGFVSGQSDVKYEADGRTIVGRAVEYDRYGNLTGKKYDVTYNNSAQWTISNIPTGTYVVDEVADGLTLGYNAVGNYYYAITDSGLSRVTKYAVTTDANTGMNYYGTGGENLRKVFSVDVSGGNPNNLYNVGQSVTVTDDYSQTKTVQVCNYYSTPAAPLELTKSFSGGTWDDDMVFSFQLEGVSATNTVLSDGTPVSYVAVPMPDASSVTGEGVSAVLNGDNTYVLSIRNSAATRNEDGSYTAKASFGNISYVYEGTYTYKITEVQSGANGVIYDTNVYYATVVVSKQYTTFSKTYSTWVNYPDGASIGAFSSGDKDDKSINKTEDFFYLGADVTYTSESGATVAKCSVRLNSGLNTANPVSNPYIITYESAYNQKGIVFVNGYAAIKVVKTAGIEGTIANGTEFSFRVYDSEGRALKVFGYSVDANGNVTKYTESKDRNIVQVGGYVVITAYKSGEDGNGNEIISNLVPGASYKVVELNSNEGDKIDGAPEGYNVSYFVTADGNDTPVEGNTVVLGSGLTTVNIVNSRLAKLTVQKTWLDSTGADDSANHTYLDLNLYRKTQEETEWTLVQTVQLTSTNGWIYTFEDLAPFDASGNAYQYRIAEDDSYYSLYSVTYSYVDANGNTTTAQGSPDYTMTLDGNTYDYGSLTITNMSLVNNLLPSTGGIGTTVFRIIGGLLVLAAIAFFIMKRSKKS